MPPTYRGYLPDCLSPLNPYHYLLLAYWIFFRPSAFRAYLYRANPVLYQQKDSAPLQRSLAISPYRNLYLMIPLLAILLSLSIVLIASWSQNTPVEWRASMEGVAVGVIVGVAVGMAGGVAFGVAFDRARGVVLGVGLSVGLSVMGGLALNVVFGVVVGIAFGVAVGLAEGIAFSMAFGVGFGLMASVVLSVAKGVAGAVGPSVTFGVAGGLASGMVLSMVRGVAESVARSMAGSVALGMIVGVAGGVAGNISLKILRGIAENIDLKMVKTIVQSMALSIAFSLVGSVALGVVFGVVVGVAFGVTGGLAEGMAFSIAFGLMGGVILSVAGGVAEGVVPRMAFGVAGGVVSSIAGGVAEGMGLGIAEGVVGGVVLSIVGGVAGGLAGLRALFYPYQLIVAFLSKNWKFRHPVEWDEFLVLPLPYTGRTLTKRLQQDEREGVRILIEVAQNPFQRWAVQRALSSYLNHSSTDPFRFLYTLPTTRLLSVQEKWVGSRASQGDRGTVRQLLLGEFVGEWVNISEDGERLIWNHTQFLRTQQDTPLTRFARLLYELSYTSVIQDESFDLRKYHYLYTSLNRYPDGKEITRSFTAMATFLSYHDLSAIALATNQVVKLSPNDASIRPAVLSALVRLGHIGKEVAAYRASTSRVNQLAPLARATEALDDLDEYVAREVPEPERAILRRVIRQWQPFINEALGKVGRKQTLRPVANPYIAGNPVTGDLFVGREDIMRRLEELWIAEGQSPSVVIYGHRRMGKTSILQNLDQRLGAHTTIIDFNMQRVGYVRNTGELLYYLALALYDTLPAAVQTELAEPNETPFLTRNPYGVFDRFLKRQFAPNRNQQRYLITIDEFELIEAAIDDGRLEPNLIEFWRGLIQSYPWFVLAFAGLHTLDEMTYDYWNPLFGSVKAIHVGFLRRNAARLLITKPSPDFPLDYHADAIESIITLTNGQPYLIQLICHAVVTRHNRQTFEEGIKRERGFTLADVEVIIHAPEFFRDGARYFTGVWQQAETSSPPAQTTILRVLAPSERGLPLDTIAQQANLTPPQAHSALQVLVQHDILTEEDGTWHFTVELMRRWVAREKNKRETR